jgi:hypothetical protein
MNKQHQHNETVIVGRVSESVGLRCAFMPFRVNPTYYGAWSALKCRVQQPRQSAINDLADPGNQSSNC